MGIKFPFNSVCAGFRIRGSVHRKYGDFRNSIERIFMIILKAFFFVFIIMVRSINVLDPEDQPESKCGPLGHTEDVSHYYMSKK